MTSYEFEISWNFLFQEKSDKQLKREAKKAEKQAKKAQHKSANEDQKIFSEVNEMQKPI